jgi:hypothetical protein
MKLFAVTVVVTVTVITTLLHDDSMPDTYGTGIVDPDCANFARTPTPVLYR